jgi:hypothetical protein
MIVTRMELFSAITGQRSTLVEIRITNDGTSTRASRGNYDWVIKGRRGQTLKRGRLENWPRQARTPCALLQRVINEAYPNVAEVSGG